jgi:plastocyanin
MIARRTSLIVVALLLLVGCSNRQAAVNKRAHSGTGTATATDGVQQITITASADLRFHPSTIIVHPGPVRIVLENVPSKGGGPPHDIQFAGLPGDDVPLTPAGDSQSVTFTAPAPGTYNFVCSIHATQGQTGKMIVE